jgi:hypothetical protein
MRAVQDPQHILVATNLEPQRAFGEEMKASRSHPLMAAMQATAVAKAPDHSLRLSWEDKLAQAGALAAFFACHQNRMSRRHEPAQRQMFAHLHPFFCHVAPDLMVLTIL